MGLSPALRQSQSCHVHRAFRFASVIIVVPLSPHPLRGELTLAQDHHFDPTILLAPGLSVIGCNRVRLAVPASRDPLWANAVSHKEVSHSRSTLLGQVEVIGLGPDAVGMTFNKDMTFRILSQEGHHWIQVFHGLRFEVCSVELKQYVS